MGHMLTDGKTVDVTAPAGDINFGDLYRISGWTGIAMKTIAAADTDRGMALEVSERVWKVKLPAALTPAMGDHLDWSTGAGFKKGDTDLVAAAAAQVGPPAVPASTGVVKVLIAKNAAGYAAVRLTEQRIDA